MIHVVHKSRDKLFIIAFIIFHNHLIQLIKVGTAS